jgi:hypothetical protein
MIAWLTVLGIALIRVAIIALILALIAAILATLAERDLGVGLFADPDA